MKKLTLLALLIAVFSLNSRAQLESLPGYMKVESYLSESDKDSLSLAIPLFDKASKLKAQAQAEETKYQKLFNKNNKKKAEKKTVDAKKFYIQSADAYVRGYNIIFEIYGKYLKNAEFYSDTEKSEANKLLGEAETYQTRANNSVIEFKKSDDKSLKKEVRYLDMKNELNNASDFMKNAVENQAKVLDMMKGMKSREQEAWIKADAANSIEGYMDYLKVFDNGLNADEARTRIAAIRRKNDEDKKLWEQRKNETLVFRVQIAAMSKPLTKAALKRLYSGPLKTEMIMDKTDKLYKYTVGDFKDYNEAKAFRAKLNNPQAFVIAFREGKRIDIKEALGKDPD